MSENSEKSHHFFLSIIYIVIALFLLAIIGAVLYPLIRSADMTPKQYVVAGLQAYEAKDYKKAVFYWQAAAKEGIPEAQYQMALLYDAGKGVKEDKGEALRYVMTAATQGHRDAIYTAAVWTERGYDGTDVDPLWVIDLYEKAAELGHINAMKSLISIYYNSELIPPNSERKSYWLARLKALEENK